MKEVKLRRVQTVGFYSGDLLEKDKIMKTVKGSVVPRGAGEREGEAGKAQATSRL